MSINVFCKSDANKTPKSPDYVSIRCQNCEEKGDGSPQWKKLQNYPYDMSCPECGEIIVQKDPRNGQRSCQFTANKRGTEKTEHELYCCRCGTWLVSGGYYGLKSVSGRKWKCPNDNCSFVQLKKSLNS